MIKKFIPNKMKQGFRKAVKEKYNFKDNNEIYNHYYPEFIKEQKEARESIEKEIPSLEVDEKHIENLKILLNRNQLLKNLPIGACCAEIGVNEGEFSEEIIRITKPRKLHLIDLWDDPSRYHDGLRVQVAKKFEKEIENNSVEINVGYSTEIIKNMPDNYFDWVYLDTDHSYKTTALELSMLKSKIKNNGIIAGHDYIVGNWRGGIRYGVIEAVNEFCVLEDWEYLYLTIRKNEMPSFAIKKIEN
ncbi:hypothetical protein BH11BAC3_BH11BAC3_19470 [soil metagenome]